MRFFKHLKIRWKLLAVVLPLVVVPVVAVGTIVGYVSTRQAYQGVTQASRADLEHMAQFTLDLLQAHHRQFQVYKEDRQAIIDDNLVAPNETHQDLAFEKRALEDLKAQILAKKVGQTGYIYAMTPTGKLTIHPFLEGKNIYDAQDESGHYFIREMSRHKNGWIRYPWKNVGDTKPRMKLVHYKYFEPWGWIVAVGSYEDEFYRQADETQHNIFVSMGLLTLIVGVCSAALVLFASKVLTNPIRNMILGIRAVQRGRLDTRLPVISNDELGELAASFNRMMEVIRRNKTLEANLAQQGKMASLGVLSAGVAHEINNPLGVILGYAAYLEGKMIPADPKYKYIQEIKRESKRCKTIVQDLLSYARVPKPFLEKTDINELLEQIIDFSEHHTDMAQVTVEKRFDAHLPPIKVDRDQLRQVAMNLILNAGAAMPQEGRLTITTSWNREGFVEIVFQDNGGGISPDDLEKIFQPFFTTKSRGTGLGLAITKTIVEQHGGSIRVDSVLNQGTCVTIRIPEEEADHANAADDTGDR